jgi:flagellar protein FliO/FliZ
MDLDVYLRFVLALVFVLALIGVVAWVGRRMGFLGRVTMGRGNTGRIGVVETTTVDAKRRLVLLRRDGVEHLVLLGPTSETLIESGIKTGVPTKP